MEFPSAAELSERMGADPAVSAVSEALREVPGCWLVGGAVRDLALGHAPLDVDVVVEGDAEAAAAAAARALGGTVADHDRFGTATVAAPGLTLDLAAARRESYPRPGALPDVRPAGIAEDLSRRDFAANAIAASLDPERPGLLLAAEHAREDIEDGVLRVLHSNSFLDDPTRLLRLARYAARLGFGIEPGTGELAREAIAAGAPGTVSGARIGTELRLLLGQEGALDAMGIGRELGLWPAVHPSLAPDRALAQAALEAQVAGAAPGLIVLAAASGGFEAGDLRRWLDDLGMPAPDRDAVVAAALGARELAASLNGVERASELATLCRGQAPERLALAAAHGATGPVARWEAGLREVGLDITGDDLLAAGVPAGPDVGRGLRAALAAKLDGEAAGREEELERAVAAARGG